MRLAKRLIIVVCIITFMGLCGGCGWIGETAGRAKAGTENAIDNTRDGYNKGYEEGKNK